MKNKNLLPVVGITMGDPVGIGPEILARALSDQHIYHICRPVVIGDITVMDKALKLCRSNCTLNLCTDTLTAGSNAGVIDVIELPRFSLKKVDIKQPCTETGRAMEAYITRSIDLALEEKIDAIVTCPITKTSMRLAGSKFHGHTELLAHHTGSAKYAMMMAGDRLKVVLVTIHIALSSVPRLLSIEKIYQTICLTDKSLKTRFGMDQPRIAVAGLNPHSGEDNMFGDEETRIITPAVEQAQKKEISVAGPLPPDTVFFQAVNKKFDAVICMYHDQGLIPFKLVHFKDGVNTTLGLPVIRTSVDHGTAYDIAWQGIADPTSLMEAIKMAAFQACNRKK